MTFNELQKNYWQKDAAASKLTIDSDMLIREVKRSKEAFESTIFWRDFREVAVSIVMVGVFLYGAFKSRDNIWIAGSLAVVAISMLFVAAFFIVDRRLQKKKDPRHTDPLLACIESSLTQINHQIWLLKNVFWWYLLPPGTGSFCFSLLLPGICSRCCLPAAVFRCLGPFYCSWCLYFGEYIGSINMPCGKG